MKLSGERVRSPDEECLHGGLQVRSSPGTVRRTLIPANVLLEVRIGAQLAKYERAPG